MKRDENGVMEFWSVGVVVDLEFSTPIRQHSNTPVSHNPSLK